MRLALVGYGRVGRAFARLLEAKRAAFPFRITGIHTARHGTVYDERGLASEPRFGPPAASIEEFLDRAAAEIMLELTPLNPTSGEPAVSHIRAAFARRMHVVTANKGPIACAYAVLREEARRAGVQFRFESTVMDGAPLFNLVQYTLPGVEVRGFAGVLNSTSTVVIEALSEGFSREEAVDRARRLGVTEADARYDIDGWDAAAKTAALANVLMDARVTPLQVQTKGIGRLTPEKVRQIAAKGKSVRLVSRAKRTATGRRLRSVWLGSPVARTATGVRLRVRAEVLDQRDPLAMVRGTSNLLLLETDLMGTVGILSVAPGLEQTAYGLFSDVVAVARES